MISHLGRGPGSSLRTTEVSLDEGFSRWGGQSHFPSLHLHAQLLLGLSAGLDSLLDAGTISACTCTTLFMLTGTAELQKALKKHP